VNIASFLADLLHSVEIIQTDSIEQKICAPSRLSVECDWATPQIMPLTSFEARGIALVTETNGFQISELDKRSLVIAAVAAKYMAAMPAMMLLIPRFLVSVPETED
jgi:hypothetical protein